jgi:hypothetical protein
VPQDNHKTRSFHSSPGPQEARKTARETVAYTVLGSEQEKVTGSPSSSRPFESSIEADEIGGDTTFQFWFGKICLGSVAGELPVMYEEELLVGMTPCQIPGSDRLPTGALSTAFWYSPGIDRNRLLC